MKKVLFIIVSISFIISLTGCIIIPIEPDIELTHGTDRIEKIEIYEVPEGTDIIEAWGRCTDEYYVKWYSEHSGDYVYVENITTELEPVATVAEEDYEAFLDEMVSLPFSDYIIIVLAAIDPAYHYSSPLIIITYDDGTKDILTAAGQMFGNDGTSDGLERNFECDEAIFDEFIKKYTEKQ